MEPYEINTEIIKALGLDPVGQLGEGVSITGMTIYLEAGRPPEVEVRGAYFQKPKSNPLTETFRIELKPKTDG